MIAYTMVGTTNLKRAVEFYNPLFAEMNLDVCWQDDLSVSYGRADDINFPRFFVGYPFDGNDAGVGNGTMTAFQFSEPEKVNKLYNIAMNNGGSDEGAPGFRPRYAEDFYAAYVRDPDGNKLAFIVYSAENN